MDSTEALSNTLASRVPHDDLQLLQPRQVSDDDGDDCDYDIPLPETFSNSHSQNLTRPSSTAKGIFSKIPFVRALADGALLMEGDDDGGAPPTKITSAIGKPVQQIKTRRRRGSLRKIALLGRGAQQGGGVGKDELVIDTSGDLVSAFSAASSTDLSHSSGTGLVRLQHDALGLEVPDVTAQPSKDGYASQNSHAATSNSLRGLAVQPERGLERLPSYNSTTDEDDVLHMPKPGPSASSGSDSYFAGALPHRRRSVHQAKSPLSYGGLSATGTPTTSDWDYTETEWWGWVVLCVTWFVFVIGMGSCLDVWSWAWGIGRAPYAPPELEDDETLPIVGYYPALIILTGVMAWVWVVVAWVGMKYFRHAKISGD